jgi:PAS domain S-box-containing protein
MKSAVPPSPARAGPLAQASVLLVDARQHSLLALEATLAPLGQPLLKASSGEEALRLLLEKDCAVVVMDAHLAGLGGLEVARLMRERERTRATPILLFTESVEDLTRLAASGLALGAIDLLLKPFDPEALRTKVRAHLEQATHLENAQAAQREPDLLSRLERAETALRQSEERFRLLADTIPQLVWTTGPDGLADYYNRRWLDFADLTAESLHTRGWGPAVHPGDVSGSQRAWRSSVSTGRPFEYEFRFLHRDGTYRWCLARAVPIRDAHGHIIKWFGTATDIHEQKRAEETKQFLAETSELLSSSLDEHTVLQRLAEQVVPRLADWAAVDLLQEEGGVERVAASQATSELSRLTEEAVRLEPLTLALRGGISQVVRTGELLHLTDFLNDALLALVRDDEQLRQVRALGLRAVLHVPLKARQRVLGVLTLLLAESGRRFSDADEALAQDVARRAGLAVDNARLYREAQQARERTERLQTVAAALSRAAAPEEVARVVLTEGLRHARTHAGVVFLEQAGGHLSSLHDVGYPEHLSRGFRELKAEDEAPPVEVTRTGEPLWFPSTEELRVRYPRFPWFTPTYEARAGLPLTVEGRTLGCLWLSFEGQRAFAPVERDFLTALAQLCAQALQRAMLFGELREREDRLRMALEATGLGTWAFYPEQGVVHWDERCKALFGLPPDAPVDPDTFERTVHPEDRERVRQAVQRAMRPESGGVYHEEFRTVAVKDGRTRWVDARGKAHFDALGRVLRFTGTVLDITERRFSDSQK